MLIIHDMHDKTAQLRNFIWMFEYFFVAFPFRKGGENIIYVFQISVVKKKQLKLQQNK